MAPLFLAIAGSAFGIWCAFDAYRVQKRLTALRRNCFITNERGHRVRYDNASPELRARVER